MSRASAGLRHRVTIQDRAVSLADDGSEVITWVDVAADEPAAVVPQRGNEYYASAQINADLAYKVVVRFRPDVNYTSHMRIVWESRLLDIEAPLEVGGRGRLVELMCRERDPQGFRI